MPAYVSRNSNIARYVSFEVYGTIDTQRYSGNKKGVSFTFFAEGAAFHQKERQCSNVAVHDSFRNLQPDAE